MSIILNNYLKEHNVIKEADKISQQIAAMILTELYNTQSTHENYLYMVHFINSFVIKEKKFHEHGDVENLIKYLEDYKEKISGQENVGKSSNENLPQETNTQN